MLEFRAAFWCHIFKSHRIHLLLEESIILVLDAWDGFAVVRPDESKYIHSVLVHAVEVEQPEALRWNVYCTVEIAFYRNNVNTPSYKQSFLSHSFRFRVILCSLTPRSDQCQMLQNKDWTILEHAGQQQSFLPVLAWSSSWPNFWSLWGKKRGEAALS